MSRQRRWKSRRQISANATSTSIAFERANPTFQLTKKDGATPIAGTHTAHSSGAGQGRTGLEILGKDSVAVGGAITWISPVPGALVTGRSPARGEGGGGISHAELPRDRRAEEEEEGRDRGRRGPWARSGRSSGAAILGVLGWVCRRARIRPRSHRFFFWFCPSFQ